MAAESTVGVLVETKKVSKTYPGVIANHEIDFSLHPGEIHCILGEIGSGKTTLCRLLAGLEQPSSGTIRYGGQPVSLSGIKDALTFGVSVLPEMPLLVPSMTVLENVILYDDGTMKKMLSKSETWVDRLLDRFQLNREQLAKKIVELMHRFDIDIDPNAQVANLPFWQQKQVEILKALYRDSKVLIIENPIAHQTPALRKLLYGVLRRTKQENRGIMLSTTSVDVVEEIADRVTVLRQGQVVDSMVREEMTRERLTELMVGKSEQFGVYRITSKIGKPLLQLQGVSLRGDGGDDLLRTLSFEVHAGESFGIVGGDRDERIGLKQLLTGVHAPDRGKIFLNGRLITTMDVRDRRAAGMGLIASILEDEGIVPSFSVAYNIILGRHYRPPFVNASQFLKRDTIIAAAREIIRKNDLHNIPPTINIDRLSDSNRQKIVVARELESDPLVIIAFDLTRGIDFETTDFIYRRLVAAKLSGKALVVITQNIDEALLITDRIALLENGGIKHILNSAETGKEKIIRLITSGSLSSRSASDE